MYICSNCHKEVATVISHPEVTGHSSFCEADFFEMCRTLSELRGKCPVCNQPGYLSHQEGCIYGQYGKEKGHGGAHI